LSPGGRPAAAAPLLWPAAKARITEFVLYADFLGRPDT